jgi:hypothetical protein
LGLLCRRAGGGEAIGDILIIRYDSDISAVTRENATTSRVSILLPKSTVTDRDLQFRETSIVVDDETDAAFLRRRQ